MDIPRPEHPKPQFERADWINLNGPWTCTFDFGKSGMDRGLFASKGFERTIIVPFCPESSLSSVGHKDFIESMWYHRRIEIPTAWKGRRVMLHFGGVDYECEAYIDGKRVGRHWGGTVSFTFDVTPWVEPGRGHDLVLYVFDDTRSGRQAGGKQSPEFGFKRKKCHYTRTTGIWQTVWLEAVHHNALRDCHVIPDLDRSRFVVVPRFLGLEGRPTLEVSVLDGGREIAKARRPAADGMPIELALEEPKTWSPQSPFLYDLVFRVFAGNGTLVDQVSSYAGLRKVHVEGNRIYLNNAPIYLRLVLDQGFYPDGVWTAPTEAHLRKDIELAMAAGFNGARLHQKVFEERFHYWADRLGYLTWGESASWGVHVTEEVGGRNILGEWREIVERDRNHPSIIAWTPLNETRFIEPNPRQHNRLHADLYDLAKSVDPTRPVNDASGYIHVKTDLWTVHSYLQSPGELRSWLAPDAEDGVRRNYPDWEPDYAGQPYLVDEYGGIKWITDESHRYMDTSWGYGNEPRTIEEFYRRLEGLTEVILSMEHICGYCYTQLTDVEQEQNGIYYFDRTEKVDMGRIRRVFERVPPSYSR